MTAYLLLPALRRRTAVVGCVFLAHLTALALLLSSTRPRVTSDADSTAPMLWTFIQPVPPHQESARGTPSRPLRRRAGSPAAAPPAQSARPPDTRRIDWAEQARSTAIQEVDREEAERRRAAALAPPKSAAFSARAPSARFGWDHAATHRLEPLEGGGTLINLTDQCVLVFAALILIPACALEKPPARGDLFDHLHDVPEGGSWKDR